MLDLLPNFKGVQLFGEATSCRLVKVTHAEMSPSLRHQPQVHFTQRTTLSTVCVQC